MKTKIAANMFRGIEAVGGFLYFEEEQMIFKSHFINIQTGDTIIKYTDIANVQKRNTLRLVPNGIIVTAKDETEYKFVIWNRDEVIQFIKEKAKITMQYPVQNNSPDL